MSHAIRRFTEPRLVVATHNAGKRREIDDLLAPFDVEILSAADLGLPEPEETGATFAENAILKAQAAAEHAGMAALADDSGLSVDRLDGAPGIHSARWAGPERDFAKAMRAVEDRLEAAGATAPSDRQAHFISVLALAWPDGHCEVFEGRADGTLVWPPRGSNGFGYDPVFLPVGEEQTYGEMAPARKLASNHRTAAFAKLIDACFRG